jgi:hypothetical protein
LTRISNQTRSKWKRTCGFANSALNGNLSVDLSSNELHSTLWTTESGLMGDWDVIMNIRSRIQRGGLIREIVCENWVAGEERSDHHSKKLNEKSSSFFKSPVSSILLKNQCLLIDRILKQFKPSQQVLHAIPLYNTRPLK